MRFSVKIILFGLFFGGVIFIVGINFAKAEILNSDGVGFHTAWQNNGGGGGTFDRVDDYPITDDDTTYNTTSTALAQQSYSLTNTNKTAGTIRNIKVWARARSAGTADSIKLFLRSGSTDYLSTDIPVTTFWADYFYQWDTKGGSSWSIFDLNSLEAGFQLVGGGQEHRVTMMYAQVEYSSEIKTVKYHVTQKLLPISSGSTINDQFSFYIADDLDEVKSAYIEIKGVALPINPLTLDVSVDDTGAPYPTGSPRLKTYTINASGRVTPFKFSYDTTNYFKTFVIGSNTYSRYFNLKVTGDSVYVLGAKLVITYTWVKPPVTTGGYKAFGILISSTFDTGQTSGAAYNSVIWKGLKPVGTKVKLQIASSNNQAGPWNSGDFVGGSACDSNNWWEPDADVAQEVKCYSQLNNKRYFRYKAKICSSSNCVDSGTETPRVDDIVVNFSP